MNKVGVQLLDINSRKNTFDEVSKGYNKEEALLEASRCLNCANKPCVSGCPVNINIPKFISLIRENKINEAYEEISKESLLPEICGRVCPQETQCEARCVRGIKGDAIAIGRLERYVADNANKKLSSNKKLSLKKVAVIGSGPSGLSCAGTLVQKGFQVTIFEAMHEFGGVLTYGIPEFRLPKRIVRETINNLQSLGVEFQKNIVLGKTIDFSDLYDMGYEAIFIGCGAGLPNFMKIPGENLNGVYSANEFLTRINLMKSYDNTFDTPLNDLGKTIVVGGGNVAMDAARCALRCGAESVTLVYRRDFDQMPARKEEIIHAQEEGVNFLVLTNPIEILGDSDKVKAIKCVKMVLSEPDASGRKRPVVLENSEFLIDADTIIMAIGNNPNPLVKSLDSHLKINEKGCIEVDDNNMTSIPGIYAGGDIVTGAATVILAMQAGKKAALSISKYLDNEK